MPHSHTPNPTVYPLGLMLMLLALSQIANAGGVKQTPENTPSLERALPLPYYHDHAKSDDELTHDISEQLAKEQGVNVSTLQIETKDGVVHLTGTASSEEVIQRILQIARSAGAVKWVESTVTVL